MAENSLVALTADIVAAHVSNNSVAVGDVANIVQRVYGALAGLNAPQQAEGEPEKTPAVSVRSSIKPDHLVCLECGRKQKTLRRHLAAAHGLTPDQYRSDYKLPPTYPLVAPTYSEARRTMAKTIGLGRKPRSAAATNQSTAIEGPTTISESKTSAVSKPRKSRRVLKLKTQ